MRAARNCVVRTFNMVRKLDPCGSAIRFAEQEVAMRVLAAGLRCYFTTRSIFRHSLVEPTFGLALGSSVPTNPPWLLVQ